MRAWVALTANMTRAWGGMATPRPGPSAPKPLARFYLIMYTVFTRLTIHPKESGFVKCHDVRFYDFNTHTRRTV